MSLHTTPYAKLISRQFLSLFRLSLVPGQLVYEVLRVYQ